MKNFLILLLYLIWCLSLSGLKLFWAANIQTHQDRTIDGRARRCYSPQRQALCSTAEPSEERYEEDRHVWACSGDCRWQGCAEDFKGIDDGKTMHLFLLLLTLLHCIIRQNDSWLIIYHRLCRELIWLTSCLFLLLFFLGQRHLVIYLSDTVWDVPLSLQFCPLF